MGFAHCTQLVVFKVPVHPFLQVGVCLARKKWGPCFFTSYIYRAFLATARFVFLCALLTVSSCFLQASLNFDDPTLKSLLKALPEAPAKAQRQCLQRCGLYKDENKTYGSGDGDKR